MERLQKFLAEAGIASRRKSEEYILHGRVSVNGKTVTELGTKVSESDNISFDGKPVKANPKKIYLLLNKPEGCVTTSNDQFGRKTVIDLLTNIEERIYPVGRLDYDTSGLLLLTNDGDLAYKLTHPKHSISKTYIAEISGIIEENAINTLRNGIIIDGRKTFPAEVEKISDNKKNSVIKISICEGRNRQIRKMCESVKHNVIKLKRIAIGEIKLGELKKGEYRILSEKEILYLKKL